MHGPLHVDALRTDAALPKRPAAHWPEHVAAVSPAVAPNLPGLHRPVHVATVREPVAP